MRRIAVLLVIFIIGTAGTISAQPSIRFRGSDGWGVGSRYDQLFSIYNLQTITGKISRIDTVTPMPDMGYGIQLFLKTDREEMRIHLGPSWFILHQDMSLGINDEVEVKGTRTSLNGKQIIIAAEIKRKDRFLKLRDEEGIPYWCSWRKK